jgi:hypothetical protein
MARKRSPAAPIVPTPAQPPSALVAVARSLISLLTSLSLYAAPCLSGGSIVAAFHQKLQIDLITAFTLGFFALVGPVYLTYASGWGMRRTLTQIRDWERAGLISAAMAQRLRTQAIAWYISRRF